MLFLKIHFTSYQWNFIKYLLYKFVMVRHIVKALVNIIDIV